MSVLAANAEKMEKHLPRLWGLLPLKELLVAFCINTMCQEEAAPKTGVTGDEPVATELQTALTCFGQKSGEKLEFCSRCPMSNIQVDAGDVEAGKFCMKAERNHRRNDKI